MKALTEKQRNLIEENHSLIYGYLNRKNLEVDDYYDIVAIGLCKAAKNYDLEVGEFSTFAYKCMNNEVKNYLTYIKGVKKVPEELVMSYDISLNESDDSMSNAVIRDDVEVEDILIHFDYEKFKNNNLNARERLIIKYLENGFKQSYIAEELNFTQQYISSVIKNIKKKWNDFYNN